MKDLIAKIRRTFEEAKNRIQKAMNGLGDIDKMDVAIEVRNALGAGKYYADSLEEIGQHLDSIEANLADEMKAAGEAALNEALESGDVIRKSDHELALNQAKEAGKGEAQAAYQAQAAAAAQIAARRESAEAKFGAAVVKLLPDAAFEGSDADVAARMNRLEVRAKSMAEHGILAEKEKTAGVAGEFLAIALDDEGDGKFAARFQNFKNTVPDPIKHEEEGGAGARNSGGAGGGAPPPAGGGGSAKKDRVII